MKKRQVTESVMKIRVTDNPHNFILPENWSNESGGKAIAITEALFETLCTNAPAYIKIKSNYGGHFDDKGNRTSLMTIVPKTNVWKNTVQFYKLDNVNPDFLPIGGIGSIQISITSPNDTKINLAEYPASFLSISVLSMHSN